MRTEIFTSHCNQNKGTYSSVRVHYENFMKKGRDSFGENLSETVAREIDLASVCLKYHKNSIRFENICFLPVTDVIRKSIL